MLGPLQAVILVEIGLVAARDSLVDRGIACARRAFDQVPLLKQRPVVDAVSCELAHGRKFRHERPRVQLRGLRKEHG